MRCGKTSGWVNHPHPNPPPEGPRRALRRAGNEQVEPKVPPVTPFLLFKKLLPPQGEGRDGVVYLPPVHPPQQRVLRRLRVAGVRMVHDENDDAAAAAGIEHVTGDRSNARERAP